MYPCKTKSPTRRKEWAAASKDCLPSDKKRGKKEKDLVILFNGNSFYTPLIPVPLAEAVRVMGQLGNVLGGLNELSTSILQMLPEGILKDVYRKLPAVASKLLLVVKSTNIGSGTCRGRFIESADMSIPSSTSRKRRGEALADVDLDVPIDDCVEAESQNNILQCNTKKPDLTCFCGVKLKSFEGLTKHIEKKHPISNDWTCSSSKCDINVSSQSSMWKHFRTQHLQLYLYRCPKCDMASDEKAPVAYHLYDVHNITVTELISCPTCPKNFATQSSYRRHSAICTVEEGSKPFSCTDCDKSFRSKESLHVHIRSHHPKEGEGAKWYVCTICSTDAEAVKFQQLSSLAKHMKSYHNIVTPKKKKR